MSKIEEEIAKNLAVPVYEDALQPFAKEISKGLLSVAKSVNAGLFLMEDCIKATVGVIRLTAEQLAMLPPEGIDFSRPRVALQALDQAKYAVDEIETQKLFAGLIASSLTADKKNSAHPAYIEVIKQLQPDEALILKYMLSQERHRSGSAPTIDIMRKKSEGGLGIEATTSAVNLIAEDAGCVCPENYRIFFENLKRVGLVTHSSGTSFSQDQHKRIFESSKARKVYETEEDFDTTAFTSGSYTFTAFGWGFARCCITVGVK